MTGIIIKNKEYNSRSNGEYSRHLAEVGRKSKTQRIGAIVSQTEKSLHEGLNYIGDKKVSQAEADHIMGKIAQATMRGQK